MPTYVTLAEYVQQDIESARESSDQFDRMREEAGDRDGELREGFVTFGEYDVVMLSEFPDDESYAQFALTVADAIGLDTETLRAFTENEVDEILAGLHGPPGRPPGEQ